MKIPIVRLAIASIVVFSLASCTPQKPVPTPPTPNVATSSATPSPTPEKQSRGMDGARLPAWIVTDQGLVAAEFVQIATSPDARLEERPTNAWRRATKLCAPELAKEIQNQKDLYGPGWWQELYEHDGYVSVAITNIHGETPQSVGDPTLAPGEDAEFKVYFQRTYHRADRRPVKDLKYYVWDVTVKKGKVTEFNPAAVG